MSNLIGKKVEEFSVPSFHEDTFKTVTNKDLEGKWSVFFFYPGDFTFVCPTELEDLANYYPKFQELGCEVYGVSTDSEFVHKAWKDTSAAISKVNYHLLSDRAFRLSEIFGVLIPGEGQALRGSFVVNPDGEIVAYEVHAPGLGRDAKELLRKVEMAQFVYKHGDSVCPAAWNPGDEILKPGIDLVGKI